MFGKMKNFRDQFQVMQRLMKDENFKAFMANPKVQELFRDPEFQEILKTKDSAKIMTHPGLNALIRDPETAALMAKLDPSIFSG